MSRTKATSNEEELSVPDSAAENTNSAVETAVETQPEAAEKVSSGESPETAAKTAEKKYGAVRYFQNHPIENKTLERTLRKMYGSEAHSDGEWEQIIKDFLNQKV